jgi:hypothetical protein
LKTESNRRVVLKEVPTCAEFTIKEVTNPNSKDIHSIKVTPNDYACTKTNVAAKMIVQERTNISRNAANEKERKKLISKKKEECRKEDMGEDRKEEYNSDDEEHFNATFPLEMSVETSEPLATVEFDSLSDFGKLWNLIMNWVTPETIEYFLPVRLKGKREMDSLEVLNNIPSIDGQTMDISRRKAFAQFTSSYLNEMVHKLQLPYAVFNSFSLCVSTFSFEQAVPSLNKNNWSQIVLIIVLGLSKLEQFLDELPNKIDPVLPQLVNDLSIDLYTVNLLTTLLRTGE